MAQKKVIPRYRESASIPSSFNVQPATDRAIWRIWRIGLINPFRECFLGLLIKFFDRNQPKEKLGLVVSDWRLQSPAWNFQVESLENRNDRNDFLFLEFLRQLSWPIFANAWKLPTNYGDRVLFGFSGCAHKWHKGACKAYMTAIDNCSEIIILF